MYEFSHNYKSMEQRARGGAGRPHRGGWRQSRFAAYFRQVKTSTGALTQRPAEARSEVLGQGVGGDGGRADEHHDGAEQRAARPTGGCHGEGEAALEGLPYCRLGGRQSLRGGLHCGGVRQICAAPACSVAQSQRCGAMAVLARRRGGRAATDLASRPSAHPFVGWCG